MKQFIYLDTDIVNSIIAQKDKGLVLETASEHEDTTGSGKEKTFSAAVTGSVSGGFWKFAQVQADLDASGGLSHNDHSQTVLKEIATKTLHDAAFDIAYEQIKEKCCVDLEGVYIGSFVEMNQHFEFVDLEYLDSLFADGGLIDYLKTSEKGEIESQANEEFTANLSREQQRKAEREIKKQIDALISQNNKKYEDIQQIIKIIRQIVPYSRLLVSSDGYLVPLEDKFFRDNPKTMGFKHGGDVTCVGYITNIIGETSVPGSDNVFSQIQYGVNQVLISILPTKEKDLFVVHPIAIYYGE